MTHTTESKLAEELRKVPCHGTPDCVTCWPEGRLFDLNACGRCKALAAYDASLKQGAMVEAVWHTNPSIDASARRVFGTPPTPHATTDTTDAAQGVPAEIGKRVKWANAFGTVFEGVVCGAQYRDDWHQPQFRVRLDDGAYVDAGKDELQFQPIPAEQQAASEGRRVVTDAKEQAIADIIRDMCESDPADPQKDTTVCINVSELEQIVRDHCETFASTLPAGDEGMRAVIAEVAAWHRKMNLRLSGMGTGKPHGRFATALEAIAAKTAGGGK